MSSTPEHICEEITELNASLSELFPLDTSWLHEEDLVNEITNLYQSEIFLCEQLIDEEDVVVQLCNYNKENRNHKPQTDHYFHDYQHSYFEHSIPFTSEFSDNTCSTACSDAKLLTTLTPPHSPKHNEDPVIANFTTNRRKAYLQHIGDQQSKVHYERPLDTEVCIRDSSTWNTNRKLRLDGIEDNVVDDIAQNVQIVDEIVNTRVNEFMSWNSSSGDAIDCFPKYSSSATSLASDQESIQGKIICVSKSRRSRPYARCCEDRRLRKKEQNKNAATRYRQKKKHEMESILNDEHQLITRNEQLLHMFQSMKQEVKYLKTLIKEFHLRKI